MFVLSLSIAMPAFAQGNSSSPASSRLIISARAIEDGMAAHAPAQSRQSRDSLKNGTIIGAVIGAVAMAGFVTWLCNELKEPGDPSCWKAVPIGGLYGAGIGAAIGLGIDALAMRQPVAIMPPRQRR
jgi:hypothetical protein